MRHDLYAAVLEELHKHGGNRPRGAHWTSPRAAYKEWNRDALVTGGPERAWLP